MTATNATVLDDLRAERVAQVIKRAPSVHVWVIGDVMLDEYIEGSVGRVSPEAPVQVVRVGRMYHRIGGAANVANGVTAFGASCALGSVVGEDPAGHTLIESCRAVGIDVHAMRHAADRPTIRKVRVLAQHQQMLRMDWELTEAPAVADTDRIFAALKRGPKPDAILLSDYAKGLLQPDFIRAIIAYGHEIGATILVDPKSSDFRRYDGATVVTPNLKELEAAAGRSLEGLSDGEIGEIARGVLAGTHIESIVVTMGHRGLLVVPRTGEIQSVRAAAREVFDVTGAGDTVIAVLAVALASGLKLAEGAWLANLAAGVVVGKVGTEVARPAEVAALVSLRGGEKVLSRADLVDRAAWWRLQGKKVVFTNGCYDLLHSGHLSLLRSAAAEGDVFVVGINSDASVRRLKGPERPLVEEHERAEILAALDCVDAVTVFDEDTPAELLAALTPDVLVKGADYAIDQVVGRELIEAHGGKVVLIPLVKGKSTSELVRRIRSGAA